MRSCKGTAKTRSRQIECTAITTLQEGMMHSSLVPPRSTAPPRSIRDQLRREKAWIGAQAFGEDRPSHSSHSGPAGLSTELVTIGFPGACEGDRIARISLWRSTSASCCACRLCDLFMSTAGMAIREFSKIRMVGLIWNCWI